MGQPRSAGATANYTGTALERFVEQRLIDAGYQRIKGTAFTPGAYHSQLLYARQVPLGPSIYESPIRADFALFHPDKWPTGLVLETKWQQSTGSIDEKFPYLVMNIKERYHYPTIIILDGGKYKPGAEQWLRRQVEGKLHHVFSMADFQRWSNQGGI